MEKVQHTETDGENSKYIEIVFDLKKGNRKIALINFEPSTKKIQKQVIIKEIFDSEGLINTVTLKQKLSKKQIENFKKYMNF